MIFLLKPFTLTYAFLFFFCWPTDINHIKKANSIVEGVKNNAIAKEFSIKKLKMVAKS